jgi:hypothetical protein
VNATIEIHPWGRVVRVAFSITKATTVKRLAPSHKYKYSPLPSNSLNFLLPSPMLEPGHPTNPPSSVGWRRSSMAPTLSGSRGSCSSSRTRNFSNTHTLDGLVVVAIWLLYPFFHRSRGRFGCALERSFGRGGFSVSCCLVVSLSCYLTVLKVMSCLSIHRESKVPDGCSRAGELQHAVEHSQSHRHMSSAPLAVVIQW